MPTISVSSKNNKKITFFVSSKTFRFCSHKKCHYIEWGCFCNEKIKSETQKQAEKMEQLNKKIYALELT